jgi:hypothetical protein
MAVPAATSAYGTLWSTVVVVTVLAAVAYWLVEVVEARVLRVVAPERAGWCSAGPGAGQPRLSRALDQPLTAPDVKPRTMNCCRLKNTTMGSRMEMNAPAVSSS